MPQKMTVGNQGEYNEFLKKEEIFFTLFIENWYETGPKIQGGNKIYSDKTVILIHIIAHLFKIGLRQTVGFIEGYLQQIGKFLQIISYSQASRRLSQLNLKIMDHRADKSSM